MENRDVGGEVAELPNVLLLRQARAAEIDRASNAAKRLAGTVKALADALNESTRVLEALRLGLAAAEPAMLPHLGRFVDFLGPVVELALRTRNTAVRLAVDQAGRGGPEGSWVDDVQRALDQLHHEACPCRNPDRSGGTIMGVFDGQHIPACLVLTDLRGVQILESDPGPGAAEDRLLAQIGDSVVDDSIALDKIRGWLVAEWSVEPDVAKADPFGAIRLVVARAAAGPPRSASLPKSRGVLEAWYAARAALAPHHAAAVEHRMAILPETPASAYLMMEEQDDAFNDILTAWDAAEAEANYCDEHLPDGPTYAPEAYPSAVAVDFPPMSAADVFALLGRLETQLVEDGGHLPPEIRDEALSRFGRVRQWVTDGRDPVEALRAAGFEVQAPPPMDQAELARRLLTEDLTLTGLGDPGTPETGDRGPDGAPW